MVIGAGIFITTPLAAASLPSGGALLAVWVFGVRMLLKYRGNRYQEVRTASVMAFQLGFALVLPNVLAGLNQPEYYLTYFWPLKSWYGEPDGVHHFWTSGALGIGLILFGALMTFVATPLLTWRYGKRWYCSWVCGCGGLANTAGEPFRHLSNKSAAAWRFEQVSIHSVLVLAILTTVIVWVNWAIGRQHPGEVQASWWMEGFLGALLDKGNPAARSLLDKATVYVVPNMNPDGTRRGLHRTNAGGVNVLRYGMMSEQLIGVEADGEGITHPATPRASRPSGPRPRPG